MNQYSNFVGRVKSESASMNFEDGFAQIKKKIALRNRQNKETIASLVLLVFLGFLYVQNTGLWMGGSGELISSYIGDVNGEASELINDYTGTF